MKTALTSNLMRFLLSKGYSCLFLTSFHSDWSSDGPDRAILKPLLEKPRYPIKYDSCFDLDADPPMRMGDSNVHLIVELDDEEARAYKEYCLSSLS